MYWVVSKINPYVILRLKMEKEIGISVQNSVRITQIFPHYLELTRLQDRDYFFVCFDNKKG